jgi:hypothetical protein
MDTNSRPRRDPLLVKGILRLRLTFAFPRRTIVAQGDNAVGLFVAQRFDGVEARRFDGGEHAADNSDET